MPPPPPPPPPPAVIPYFGYARQDRRVRSARVPITAKVVADFLSSVGVDRVLTVDLHAEQIQGFFDVPVDNVFGSPILLEDMLQLNLDNPIVVSPDIGGVVRARAIAKLLNDTDMAIIDKRRPRANVSVIDEVVVCDTIPLTDEIKALPNVRTLTLSGMLAEAIRRISNEESISAMFEH